MKEWQIDLQNAFDGILVDVSKQCPDKTKEDIITQSARRIDNDIERIMEVFFDRLAIQAYGDKDDGDRGQE